MITIRRFVLDYGEAGTVPLHRSMLTDHVGYAAESEGLLPILIKVESNPESAVKAWEEFAQAHGTTIEDAGMDALREMRDEYVPSRDECREKIVLRGRTYVPLMQSASDARKASSRWVDVSWLSELGKWLLPGLKSNQISLSVAKFLVYLGLTTSSGKPFIEVFGTKLKFSRVCVLPDVYTAIEGMFDVTDGVTVKRERLTVNNVASDGVSFIHPSLTGGKSATLRAKWIKTLAIPFDVSAFAQRRGASPVVLDVWGNKVDLREIDLVLFESDFKGAALYPSFQAYQDACEAISDEFYVCVTEHSRVCDMPYQQLQTLQGLDVEALVDETVNGFQRLQSVKGAAGLLGGSFGRLLRAYPALLHTPYVQKAVQERYAARRDKVCRGRVPHVGIMPFAAPDPIALAEGVLGLPVKGVINPVEVVCRRFKEGEKVDITRSPHLDNAHCVRTVRTHPFDRAFEDGSIVYFSVFDKVVRSLQMDFDGDHVLVTNNRRIVEAAEQSHLLLGDRCLYYEADKAAKSVITRSKINEYIARGTEPAPIGKWAIALAKEWANGNVNTEKVAILTRGCNLCVDAAKHSDDGKSNLDDAILSEYKSSTKPLFIDFKASEAEKFYDPSHPNGIGTRWCKRVFETTPAQLRASDLDNSLTFNAKDLQYMHGATFSSNGFAGLTDLFRALAYRRANEWRTLLDNSPEEKAVWEADNCKAIYHEIESFAIEHGRCAEEAAEYLLGQLFGLNGQKYNEKSDQLYRTFFCVFSDVLLLNLESNRKDGIVLNTAVEEEEAEDVPFALDDGWQFDSDDSGCFSVS